MIISCLKFIFNWGIIALHYCVCLCVGYINMNQVYLQHSNGDADVEIRSVDTVGEVRVGRIERVAWK